MCPECQLEPSSPWSLEMRLDQVTCTSRINFSAPPRHWEPFSGGGSGQMLLGQPSHTLTPAPISCLVAVGLYSAQAVLLFPLFLCQPKCETKPSSPDPGLMPHSSWAPHPGSRTLTVVSRSLGSLHSKQLPVTEGWAASCHPPHACSPPAPNHPGLPFLLHRIVR